MGVILGAGIFGDAVNVGRCSFEGVIFLSVAFFEGVEFLAL